MKTFRSCSLIASLLVGACSGYKVERIDPAPVDAYAQPSAEYAQICVLRPHWAAPAVTFPVHDNDRLVGATISDSYFCYHAEPGRHRIVSRSDQDDEAVLDAVGGGVYYLHQDVENIAGYVRAPLRWVESGRARDLVEKCDYRALAEVPGKEALPDRVPFASARPTASR